MKILQNSGKVIDPPKDYHIVNQIYTDRRISITKGDKEYILNDKEGETIESKKFSER